MRFPTLYIIVLLRTMYGATVALAGVPVPNNLRITSLNMGLVLEWDPPRNSTKDTAYRAEFSGYYKVYKAVCPNTTEHSCDFTSHLSSQFGTYIFRVRAEQEGETSDWVETRPFTMDEHTSLGPPSMTLEFRGNDVEVSITDPVFRISTFRNVYNHATYNITYWEDGREGKAKQISDSQQSRVVVPNLKPWTRYCFQVQVNTQRFSKHSQHSNVTCESTGKGNDTPWVAALVTFVVLFMTVIFVVLGVLYCRRIVRFLWPKSKLPEHFKEYLLVRPRSSIFLAMSTPLPEEVYHQVSIMVEGTEEVALPLVDGGTNCTPADKTDREQVKEEDMGGKEEGGEMKKGGERTRTEMDGREEDLLLQPV